jgi:mono/diheme cytochrome c family protein
MLSFQSSVALTNTLRSAVLFLGLSAVVWPGSPAISQNRWPCPFDKADAKNPLASTDEVINRGYQLVHQSCAECHGEAGEGDGPAAANMTPPPANWRAAAFQAQSDACIFWKLSTGRGAMPPANRMPETQRWQIVTFIRSLGVK